MIAASHFASNFMDASGKVMGEMRGEHLCFGVFRDKITGRRGDEGVEGLCCEILAPVHASRGCASADKLVNLGQARGRKCGRGRGECGW